MERYSSIIFLVGMLAFMYFFMIRPQQQQAKKRQEMLTGLQKGDRVVTIGGMHGTIIDFPDENSVVLKVSDRVEITFNKSAIGGVRQ